MKRQCLAEKRLLLNLRQEYRSLTVLVFGSKTTLMMQNDKVQCSASFSDTEFEFLFSGK
jgi:hypothetical protein